MAHDVNQCETDIAARVRSDLISKISSERLELWIPESTNWSFEADVLTLEFESDFNGQLAKQMLGQDLTLALREFTGTASEVIFRARPATEAEVRPRQRDERTMQTDEGKASSSALATQHRAATTADRSNADRTIAPEPRRRKPEVNLHQERPISDEGEVDFEKDIWDQFVSGESNQLAWAAAKLIVSEPGKLTPVFFHGPSGSGKSMLAAAIAERLRTVKRLPRVIHMTSEQFLNDFTDGLRGGGLPMFRRKYRDVEALILEDIQFFSGKKSSLTEVKHTLDNLLRLGKQVIFTADRSPNELQQLGSDLVGRLRGGLTAPLFPLDEKTRFDILSREIEASDLKIDADVIVELSKRVTGDGRVLSGIVKRLTAFASFHESDSGRSTAASPATRLKIAGSVTDKPTSTTSLDWASCWSAVSDLVQATQPIVRIVDIDRVVCSMFGLEPESLQSQSKIRRVSQPRMLAMFLARKYTPAAYKEIGYYFGQRRHSTVISAEKTVENWIDTNANLELGRGLTVRDAIRNVESQLQVG